MVSTNTIATLRSITTEGMPENCLYLRLALTSPIVRYGQPLGPVQGVGYINELLARLTGQPVQDHTQTNHTLTSSALTFPLDRSIYADFSHDNLMIAVYSAMGLFRQNSHLDPTDPDLKNTWITSKLTPFSGRLIIERLRCSGQPSQGRTRTLAKKGEIEAQVRKETFVRVLVNDAVQPLDFCGADNHGLCALDAFVESQAYARHDGDGDFEKCYEGVSTLARLAIVQVGRLLRPNRDMDDVDTN